MGGGSGGRGENQGEEEQALPATLQIPASPILIQKNDSQMHSSTIPFSVASGFVPLSHLPSFCTSSETAMRQPVRPLPDKS